jgi:hypothetical protein
MGRLHSATGTGFLVVGGVALLTACGSSGSPPGSDAGNDASHPSDASHDTGSSKDTGASKESGAGGTCADYAADQCQYLSACEPGTLSATYGSVTNCETIVAANCTRNLSAPGTGFSKTFPAECGALLTTYAAACKKGPVARPVPTKTACTVAGTGTGGALCGLDVQCATDACDIIGSTCGRCTTSASTAGAACGPGTGVTCAVGLACGGKNKCVTVVDVGATCDRGETTACVDGATCVVAGDAGTSDAAVSGTCQASGVKTGTACSATGAGAPDCWDAAGFFCNPSTSVCAPITYAASSSTCGTADGGAAEIACSDGVCVAGSCVGKAASGESCNVASGVCIGGTVCVDADGGTTGTCTTVNEKCGTDAGLPPFTFSPTNVGLGTIYTQASMAAVENLSTSCSVQTDATSPDDNCFTSPIVAVTQEDGSTINLVVVQSLVVQSTGSILATGGVPLVIVSLSDVKFMGGNLQANSESLQEGAGGALTTTSNAAGNGQGAGPAATTTVGGGGAGYCALGGAGGSSTTHGAKYGNAAIRPLVGGSSGGGGVGGGYGGGGGAIQIVAVGSLTIGTGSYITVGGEGAGIDEGGGGGSGGSILLEAPVVTIAGTLAANGGGGASSDTSNGADGSNNATAAAGGAASAGFAAGGNGGAGTTTAGAAGGAHATTTQAGGGGGSVGRIRINSGTAVATTTAGVFSPALTTACATQGDLRSLTEGP